MASSSQKLKWVFLGGRPLGVASLTAFKAAGYLPTLIITGPDRPAGRGQVMTAPPEKIWGNEHGIEVLQPEQLKSIEDNVIARGPWDVFVLAAYGQILSKKFIAIPLKGIVNMHPSFLPKMRGPSPIRSSLLTNAPDAVGVTIMLIDTKMDHGPILAQKKITPQQWPLPGRELDALLIERGAQLLAETVPQYIDGTLKPKEQEHDQATYCKMFSKEDARIDLNGDPHVNLFKIAAYDEWPGAYTFIERSEKQVRVKIVSAHIESNTLVLDRIVPEGKSEMNYSDFIRAQ